MYSKSKKSKPVEVDLISSISGRLRLRVENEPSNPLKLLTSLKKMTFLEKGRYCSVNRTFVLEYKPNAINLNNLIMNFCGFYCADLGIKELKLNYRLSKKDTMGYSSLVSFAAILADAGLNLFGLGTANRGYRNFVRWCSIGTTIGAIFEHGYKELNENGAFDPEVMSIMYLINSVNKTGVPDGNSYIFYPAAIAWLLTFGRHILTRQNRSIIISVLVDGDEIKVIEEENKYFFFNQFVGSCFDVYQNVNVRKSLAIR